MGEVTTKKAIKEKKLKQYLHMERYLKLPLSRKRQQEKFRLLILNKT